MTAKTQVAITPAPSPIAQVTARLLTAKFPPDFAFQMSRFFRKNAPPPKPEKNFCGTSGCIAGLAVVMFGDKTTEELRMMGSDAFIEKASKILGISSWVGRKLFLPSGVHLDATERQAGRVMAYFMETGLVDWSKKNRRVTVAGRTF